jgi:hypothetical protein
VKKVFLFFLVFLLPLTAVASSGYVSGYEGEVKTQIMLNTEGEVLPFDTYLKLELRDVKGSELYFYGKLWKNVEERSGGLELYQAYFKLPTGVGSLKVGRQLISEGFKIFLSDAVRLERNTGKIKYIFYAGKVSYGKRETEGSVFGLKFFIPNGYLLLQRLTKTEGSSLTFGETLKIGDTSYFGKFTLGLSPTKVKEVELRYEHSFLRKAVFTLSGEYFDYSSPLFRTFSQGRQLAFNQSFTYLLNDNLEIFEEFSFGSIKRNGRETSHLLRLGFSKSNWFERGVRVEGALVYRNSWIGKSYGVEGSFIKAINSKLFLSTLIGLSYYDKKIHGEHWYNDFQLKGDYWIDEFSNLEVGIEREFDENLNGRTEFLFLYNRLFYGGLRKRDE